MVLFPNAKINLGLHILAKRPDGYHDLESCFYPVHWREILEIIPTGTMEFSSSGLNIPGNTSDNLCLQAYHLLKEDFDLPPVKIHLHKVLPIGAGLGGGSADGAYTLKALNQKFELGLNTEELENYAAKLGSDCPFFIQNRPVLATGRGTVFEEVSIDLSHYHIVIVKPDLHISTMEAYRGITPKKPEIGIKRILEDFHPGEWKNHLHNDFEESLFRSYPQIAELKTTFYAMGALYASMTGSGAAVYGIFKEKVDLKGRFETYEVWQGEA